MTAYDLTQNRYIPGKLDLTPFCDMPNKEAADRALSDVKSTPDMRAAAVATLQAARANDYAVELDAPDPLDWVAAMQREAMRLLSLGCGIFAGLMLAAFVVVQAAKAWGVW